MRLIKAVCAVAVVAAAMAPSALAFRFSDYTRLMPTGVVGKPFSHPVETVAGCKGVYITVGPGSLPPGLRLVGDKRDDVDGSNWRIEGTPTVAGRFSFWLVAKNLCPADSTEEDFAITVVGGSAPAPKAPAPAPKAPAPSHGAPAAPTLSIQTAALPAARFGARYAARLSAAGGETPRWSIASGSLPAGLRLTPGGVVTGKLAPAARSATVAVRVEEAGSQATREFTVAVRSRVAIMTRRLATLRKGRPYVLRLRTTGGAPILRRGIPVLRWKVVRGRLPVGLRLNTLRGKLIGRPRQAGRYRITVRVTDRLGSVATRTLIVRVGR